MVDRGPLTCALCALGYLNQGLRHYVSLFLYFHTYRQTFSLLCVSSICGICSDQSCNNTSSSSSVSSSWSVSSPQVFYHHEVFLHYQVFLQLVFLQIEFLQLVFPQQFLQQSLLVIHQILFVFLISCLLSVILVSSTAWICLPAFLYQNHSWLL